MRVPVATNRALDRLLDDVGHLIYHKLSLKVEKVKLWERIMIILG